jgi:hypothetical protein
MMRSVAALALALILTGCATRVPGPDTFAFGVVGDTPYNEREEREWLTLIERVNAEPLAFTIHVGDFKGGEVCSDELFARRKAEFDRFAQPLIYTPGDNEWTDCRRPYMGSMDPLERLARIRQVFFADRYSLGARRLATEAQDQCLAPPVAGCGCAAYPENRSWEHRGVRFVTLNAPGSDNNVGFDMASDAEALCRNAANARWLERAAEAAATPAVRALVIAIQADPWLPKRPVFAGLIAQVEATSRKVGKPVLFIHGDTHTYRVDFPFATSVTRLETFGSPIVGWVKVIVDPADPQPFRFEPHSLAIVRPQ